MEEYEGVWDVLSDMILELRKRRVEIPNELMTDLRSAKTMINLYKVDPSASAEIIPRIELYLSNVEGFLYYMAEQTLGKRATEEWMKRISEARVAEVREKPKERFMPGLRRGERWVRIQVSDDLTRGKIEEMARQSGLDVSFQNEDYVLVHGDKEKIQDVIRRLTEHFRK